MSRQRFSKVLLPAVMLCCGSTSVSAQSANRTAADTQRPVTDSVTDPAGSAAPASAESADVDCFSEEEKQRIAELLARFFQSQQQHDYETALDAAEQLLDMLRHAPGPFAEGYLSILKTIAPLYAMVDDNSTRAEAVIDEILRLVAETHGDSGMDYAEALLNTAGTLNGIREVQRSDEQQQQAIAIWREDPAAGTVGFLKQVSHLANVYTTWGKFDRARELARLHLEIARNGTGDVRERYPSALNNYALILKDFGDYSAAVKLLREACELHRQGMQDSLRSRISYGVALDNLAYTYMQMGDPGQSEPLHLEAASVLLELGEEHPEFLTCLNNLAGLYESIGLADVTREIYEIVLAGRKKALFPDHPLLAQSYSNLGGANIGVNNSRAEELLSKAYAIRFGNFGEFHPDCAETLNHLAKVDMAFGKYQQAERRLSEAQQVNRKFFGDSHPYTARDLFGLGVLYFQTAQPEKSEPLIRQAVRIIRNHLENTADSQSERQQLAMSQRFRSWLDMWLSVTTRTDVDATDVWSEIFSWKGIALAQQSLTRLARKDPANKPLFDEIARTANQLATLANTPVTADSQEFIAEQTETLRQTKERLEYELGQSSDVFRRNRASSKIQPEQFRQNLPRNTALVDFLQYTHSSPPSLFETDLHRELRLAAFVVRPDRDVERIELGPADPISDVIDAWRETLGPRQNSHAAAFVAANLKPLLWTPLEDALEGIDTVLISPDGAVNRFPLPALPGRTDGTYLLQERRMAVIPVPQMFSELLQAADSSDSRSLHPTHDSAVPQGLLLVGGVNYDGNAGRPADLMETESPFRLVSRSRGTTFTWLPGTDQEMKIVRDLFIHNNPHLASHVHILRNNDARESAFRELVPNHRFVHLATHGFFAPPPVRQSAPRRRTMPRPLQHLFSGEEESDATLQWDHSGSRTLARLVTGSAAADHQPDRDTVDSGNKTSDDETFDGFAGILSIHQDPRLRSGLAMVGANRLGQAGEDDGILTSLEVETLDLSHVELATLSACETGLGPVAGGEGVFGLQRAFQVAGVRTTISTLWTISDDGTPALMKRFYNNFWHRKMSKLDALHEAQLWMLAGGQPGTADARTGKKLPNQLSTDPQSVDRNFADSTTMPPYYWAAFVLSGDWR